MLFFSSGGRFLFYKKHIKRQGEGLNAVEEQTLAGLVNRYERNLSVRSQAAALLKERRYDVSSLL